MAMYIQQTCFHVIVCVFYFRHVRAVRDLNQDLHRKLELLKTCESSMAKKDEVITSLTKSLRKQVHVLVAVQTIILRLQYNFFQGCLRHDNQFKFCFCKQETFNI